jgi:stromal membrane-associated protein|uniref:Arf-GAP domain-containing protein n=1 Tax=Ostreococcus mediterraneus TaxID=1486918 RepID=A0A6T5SPC0_9CHLO|mmetsp:Transcript_7655/g.28024  ORF Transcript_7655/g.28024 Transcript_7655/m.28024 type:complete len:443 (-) Transcript_7655:844-2172(-)
MSAREEQALHKRLVDALKRPENVTCAECDARLPRWASTSLGVFFCTNCSGAHRGLGVHISKVKSTTLDKWTEEQVEFMERMGNARANAFWQARMPAGDKPTPNASRDECERFIRKKYERRAYVDASLGDRPMPSDGVGQGGTVAAAVSSPTAAPATATAPSQNSGMFDLLSMNEPSSAPAAPPSADAWTDFSSAPVQAAPAQAGLEQWSDFSAPPAVAQASPAVPEASAAVPNDDAWGAFAQAPPVDLSPPPVEPKKKPDFSKNDIMNLFDAPAPTIQSTPGVVPMGGAQAHMGMMGVMNQQPPQMQAYQQQQMPMQMPMHGGMGMGGFAQQMPQMPPQHMGAHMGAQMGMPQQMYAPQHPGMMPQQGVGQQQFTGVALQTGHMSAPHMMMGEQFQFSQPQHAQQAYGMGNPYMQMMGQMQQPQAPPSPPKPDTQNIPEFKW